MERCQKLCGNGIGSLQTISYITLTLSKRKQKIDDDEHETEHGHAHAATEPHKFANHASQKLFEVPFGRIFNVVNCDPTLQVS